MNTKRKGALVLMAATAALVGLAWWKTESKTFAGLFVMALGGEAIMTFVLWMAEREDRRSINKAKRAGFFASLITFLFPGLAKAIIAIAIAGAVVVGILGFAVFAIISKVQSMRMNELRKPIILDQRAENTNGVNVAVVTPYHPASQPYPGIVLAAAGELAGVQQQTAMALRIDVPANATLEYSTNLTNWGPIYYAGPQDEETWWEAIGTQGFFRFRSDDANAPAEPTR